MTPQDVEKETRVLSPEKESDQLGSDLLKPLITEPVIRFPSRVKRAQDIAAGAPKQMGDGEADTPFVRSSPNFMPVVNDISLEQKPEPAQSGKKKAGKWSKKKIVKVVKQKKKTKASKPKPAPKEWKCPPHKPGKPASKQGRLRAVTASHTGSQTSPSQVIRKPTTTSARKSWASSGVTEGNQPRSSTSTVRQRKRQRAQLWRAEQDTKKRG